jgi:hypothetical protein
MMRSIREFVAQFTNDPLGTSIRIGVWLFIAAIGVVILIYLVRIAWNMLRSATGF